jgi:hypothetical protein
MIGVRGTYSSAASSALSPKASRTGVVWVWNPVIVFGFPACPTTSTAWKEQNHPHQAPEVQHLVFSSHYFNYVDEFQIFKTDSQSYYLLYIMDFR